MACRPGTEATSSAQSTDDSVGWFHVCWSSLRLAIRVHLCRRLQLALGQSCQVDPRRLIRASYRDQGEIRSGEHIQVPYFLQRMLWASILRRPVGPTSIYHLRVPVLTFGLKRFLFASYVACIFCCEQAFERFCLRWAFFKGCLHPLLFKCSVGHFAYSVRKTPHG